MMYLKVCMEVWCNEERVSTVCLFLFVILYFTHALHFSINSSNFTSSKVYKNVTYIIAHWCINTLIVFVYEY